MRDAERSAPLFFFTKGERNGFFNLHNHLSGLLTHFSYIHLYRKRIIVYILRCFFFYGSHYVFSFCNYYTCRKGVNTMDEILTISIFIIFLMVSKCVLFFPQETDRQKAVKIGCHMGTIAAFIFAAETIQKFFS